MALAAVAVACESPGDASSGTTLVDPGAGRFPDALPLYDEPSTAGRAAAGGGPSGTTPAKQPTAEAGSTPRITRPDSPGAAGPTTTTRKPTTLPATPTTTALPATVPPSTTALPAAVPPSTTAPPTTAPPTTAPTAPPTPGAPVAAVTALLLSNRATFGTTSQLQAEISRLGTEAWIDQQLARNSPEPAVESQLSGYRTLRASRQAVWAIAAEDNDPVFEELVHATVVRARYSQHQLFEMMAHFWMDHFNIKIDDGPWFHLHTDYQENVIRPHALGRFEDLLRATAESPAMLHYLNNAYSNANSSRGVNENYGRELLELHTLGIAPDGSHLYTEADVRGAALIMSGWSIVTDRNSPSYSDFVFRDNYHWQGPVSMLDGAFTSVGLGGKSAGDALLPYLAHHPTTARHLAHKLIRRFVTDTPPESLIASTAAVYLANDTDLRPVLRHIFLSSEFAAATGQKMRRPFELVLAAMRTLETDVPVNPLGQAAQTIRSRLNDLNHVPWTWEQPDGFADVAGPWLSSDGLLERWGFVARLANNFLTNQNNPDPIVSDLSRLVGTALTVGELMDDLRVRFGLPGLTPTQQDAMLSVLGLTESDPTSALDAARLGELASFLLSHPQYQVR